MVAIFVRWVWNRETPDWGLKPACSSKAASWTLRRYVGYARVLVLDLGPRSGLAWIVVTSIKHHAGCGVVPRRL